MSDLVHVKGLDDLQKLLDTLPAKLEQNVMRGALRAGMKPVRDAAKSGAAKATGALAAGLRVSVKARAGKVTASLRAAGKHGYLARWVEYGTAAHQIKAKKGSALAIGGQMVKVVDHPGAKAQPFMRPALDGHAQNALMAAGEYIKKRLSTKHGIDTADIDIEAGG